MKIAIVYNHDFQNVINLFGIPNKERIGQNTIKRIANALKAGGHQVKAIEGDKDLINKLEDFMPRVLKGEQPGLVFNLSYGIQGQARYTHVPSILEMVGIPYVGSGPLAHGMALDKVVAKTIFRQHGLPTPDFTVVDSLENMTCDLIYPLIVKPKNESVSFGVRIVNNEEELQQAIQVLVLRAGNPGNKIVTRRRGQRKYVLRVETYPRRIGKANKSPEALHWVCAKIEKLSKLSSRKERIAVAASNIKTTSFPMLLPHRIVVTLLLSYPEQRLADAVEKKMRDILGKGEAKWELEMLSDRLPMKISRRNQKLARDLKEVADKWDIPLDQESSVWPTIAGLVPESTRVVCGLGPISKQLYTPQEAVQRIGILQRTLLLAEFLVRQLEGIKKNLIRSFYMKRVFLLFNIDKNLELLKNRDQ
ncbi:MAG: hypothetical protein ABIL62_13895 [Planctomycetota bacterium]